MKLPRVKTAVASGKFTVLFDSGIRTGPDIFKATALGAQGVLCKSILPCLTKIEVKMFPVGRPWLYGSIVSGQAGIEQVIKHTVADLDHTLGLSGYASLDAIRGKSKSILVDLNSSQEGYIVQ
jgi:isopentenyl diphosphate isomerase/L-lactate dehydrogenase-like FMN-dependent dehydrogenase